jgi:hypothetical protein
MIVYYPILATARDSPSVQAPSVIWRAYPACPYKKETLNDELFTKAYGFQMAPFIDPRWWLTFVWRRGINTEPETSSSWIRSS